MPNCSLYPDVEIPDIKLVDFILKRADEFGPQIALEEDWSGRVYTYSQLKTFVRNVAYNLTQCGLRKGDIIYLYASNCLENCSLFLGALAAGATLYLMKPFAPVEELKRHMTESQPKFVFTTADRQETIEAVVNDCGENVRTIFVIGQISPHSEKSRPAEKLLENTEKEETWTEPLIDSDKDLALLQLTGGTTGTSKTVMTTHKNLITALAIIDTIMPSSLTAPGEYIMGFLPFNHLYPLLAIYCHGFQRGCRVLIMRTLSLEAILKRVEEKKPKIIHLVPPQIVQIIANDMAGKYIVSSIEEVYCGGATLNSELHMEFERIMRIQNPNLQLIQAYGMTEATGGIAGRPPVALRDMEMKHGSVGVLCPNMECKIVDLVNDEEITTTGKSGEIWLRSPQIMAGYYKRPDLTQSVIVDGWLRTGDFGYFEKSLLYVTDRVSDLIRTKDGLVSPSCIETILHGHPSVADCAVVGRKVNGEYELPFAFVVIKREVSVEELASYVNAHAPSTMQMDRQFFRFVTSIPKSTIAKILRAALREQLNEALPL